MPLFVKLKGERQLDDELEGRIRAHIRREYSPRHVPDPILQVAAVPYTLAGKKMEVPVRRILMGIPVEKAANRAAMANVEALDFFVKALGRVAGDTALTLGAQGGVYLGGGIPPKIQDALAGPAFRNAFEQKGRLTPFLKPIPVFVILARDAGLRGTAAALAAAIKEGRV